MAEQPSPSRQEADGSHIAQAAQGGVAIVIDGNDNIVYSLSPAQAQEWRELRLLLDKVKQFWINDYLQNSLHNQVLLGLGKETRLDAVEHPWERVVEVKEKSRQLMPAEVKIGDIFDEMNRAMLILGEPGAGKTITLLELASELVTRAEADPSFSQPIPVVFNLSSWAETQLPFRDWLVDELLAKYSIPKKTGRAWLDGNRILPLLDGLDEVPPGYRASCVEAINEFGGSYGLSGLAVCCRSQAYSNIPVRLKFNGAIILQPLTPEQVDAYLSAGGNKLLGLRELYKEDQSVQSFAQSPLMLNIMSLAFQDIPAELLVKESNPKVSFRQQLFDTYVDRMLSRKGQRNQPYTAEETKSWLTWLAKKMFGHSQATFLIEQLQPSWLSSRLLCWIYLLISRLTGGLVFGLAFALSGGLFVRFFEFLIQVFQGGLSDQLISVADETLREPVLETIRAAVLEGFIPGAILAGGIGGICLGIFDLLRFELGDNKTWPNKRPEYLKTATSLLITSLIGVLSFGPIVASGEGRIPIGLIIGLIFGLLFGLRGRRQSLANDIQTVEAMKWSWKRARKGGLYGAIIIGLITSLVVANKIEGIDVQGAFWPLALLTFASIGGLIGVMFGGLTSSILETKTFPNQGIKLSLINAGKAMLVFTLAFGLISALISGVVSGLALVLEGDTPLIGLINGLIFGIKSFFVMGLMFGATEGILVALWFGGLDFLQHHTLRLFLWRSGHMPRNYASFLDYASERIFLQKVGGGYIFIHRMLMEYFTTVEFK